MSKCCGHIDEDTFCELLKRTLEVCISEAESVLVCSTKITNQHCSCIESNRSDKELLKGLQNEPEPSEISAKHHDFMTALKDRGTFPIYPLRNTFARNLYRWLRHGVPPNSRQQSIPGGLRVISNDLTVPIGDCLKQLTRIMTDDDVMSEECLDQKNQSDDAISYTKKLKDNERSSDINILLIQLFNLLTMRDNLFILGLNRTQGSIDRLPPDIHQLLTSFCCRQNVNSKLTVGARALSKHCHRSSEEYWGVCTGTEDAKNQHAIEVLKKIFYDCCWINIHVLPHDVYVLEIRSSQGYGLRWSHDGKAFRGFLEPQMEHGHEVGWKH